MPVALSLSLSLFGLLLAGLGTALAHERRFALSAWQQWDGRFPEHLRTPGPTAGAGLTALGCAVVAMALLNA